MGAGRSDLIDLVLRQCVRLVAIALALGTGAALALSRVLRGPVFEIGTTDPLTFVGMAALLAVTALAACWLPARRASRVDPVTAMRSEQEGRRGTRCCWETLRAPPTLDDRYAQ